LRPARQSSGTASAFGGSARAGSANVDDQPDAGDDADSHHTFASMLTAVTSRHETLCKAKSIGESPTRCCFPFLPVAGHTKAAGCITRDATFDKVGASVAFDMPLMHSDVV